MSVSAQAFVTQLSTEPLEEIVVGHQRRCDGKVFLWGYAETHGVMRRRPTCTPGCNGILSRTTHGAMAVSRNGQGYASRSWTSMRDGIESCLGVPSSRVAPRYPWSERILRAQNGADGDCNVSALLIARSKGDGSEFTRIPVLRGRGGGAASVPQVVRTGS